VVVQNQNRQAVVYVGMQKEVTGNPSAGIVTQAAGRQNPVQAGGSAGRWRGVPKVVGRKRKAGRVW